MPDIHSNLGIGSFQTRHELDLTRIAKNKLLISLNLKRQQEEEKKQQIVKIQPNHLAYVSAYPLRQFIRDAFPVVVQGVEYRDNWHIDIISELLQAVVTLQARNTIINIPRRTMKSVLMSVMFPAWVWTFLPHLRFLYTSYTQEFAKGHNEDTQKLIESAFYQQKFGHVFQLAVKRRQKLISTKGGVREVFKIGGGTGTGGDIVIADDPNAINEIESENSLKKTANFWNTISYHNVTNRATASRLIIQQRTDADDLTGSILSNPDIANLYQVLCLAMRYESDNPNANTPSHPISLGKVTEFEVNQNPNLILHGKKLWIDPRDTEAHNFDNHWYQDWYKTHFLGRGLTSKGDGQALWENFIDEETLRQDIAHLGLQGEAAQFQQRPTPKGGLFFNTEHFQPVLDAHSINYRNMTFCRYWDKAGCFAEGTLVETINGAVPIEKIRKGDLVLTRKGYKKVEWAGISGFVDEITTATFSDGRKLNGTANHPVWTENRGWVHLGDLRSYDNILSLNHYLGEYLCPNQNEKAENAFPTPSSKSLTALLIPADRVNAITRQCVTTKLRNAIVPIPYIAQYGDSTTAKFLLGVTSITKTKIGTTTTFPTLNALREVNTIANIQTSGKHPNTVHYSPNSNLEQLRRLINGTKPHLIEPMSAKAMDAETPLKANVPTSIYPNFVLVNAKTGKSEEGKTPVYDLTVEDEHEFYANGILVHNTEGAGDETVGLLMARTNMRPFQFYILDVYSAQIGYKERMETMVRIAGEDVQNYVEPYAENEYSVGIEREGGSSGKDLSTIEMDALVGYDVFIDNVSRKGNKAHRARPVAARAESGVIKVVRGAWNDAFFRQLARFDPEKKNQKDDKIDAFSGAFRKLAFRMTNQRTSSSGGM